MQDLVLLADEVLFLTQAVLQGTKTKAASPLSHEVACDFLCKHGLTERQGETLRLTPIGHRVARKLVADGACRAVWLQRSQLELLGWPVVGREAAEI